MRARAHARERVARRLRPTAARGATAARRGVSRGEPLSRARPPRAQLLDELEDELEAGGAVVDYHGAELFPERWFDLVLVLRCDNGVLYGRLESRGYSEKKLADNVEAEIMQVILDEAREAYREDIVIELPSNTIEDIESNVQRTVQWLKSWKPDV